MVNGLHGKLTIEEDFIEPEAEFDPGKTDYDLSDLEVEDKREVKPPPPLDSEKDDASKGEGEEETAGEGEEGETADAEFFDEEMEREAKAKLKELEEEIERRREQWDGGSYENYDRDVDESVIPNYMGGQMPLTATREEIEEAKSELKRMQEAAKKAAERAAALAKAAMESSGGGEASGISTGVEEPKVLADEPQYSALVRKNTPYISRLLNYLKQLQTVTWSTARFARRGRYMIEMHPVFRLMSGGKGKPFDRRFEGHTRTIDKVKV